MKLYLLSQTLYRDYDTYDSCIVCAESEEEARKIRPDNEKWFYEVKEEPYYGNRSWVGELENVNVEYLGEAKEGLEKGIILSSFNAG